MIFKNNQLRNLLSIEVFFQSKSTSSSSIPSPPNKFSSTLASSGAAYFVMTSGSSSVNRSGLYEKSARPFMMDYFPASAVLVFLPLALASSTAFIYSSKSAYFLAALRAFHAKNDSFVTGVRPLPSCPSLGRAALSASIYSSSDDFSFLAFSSASFFMASLSFLETTTYPSGS